MKISCLSLDAAMDALVLSNAEDREYVTCYGSYDESGVVARMQQAILVRTAAYNELLNARISEYGAPV